MMSFTVSGLRARLSAALGTIAAMTLVASAVAYVAMDQLEGLIDRLSSDTLPAVALASSLAEHGSSVTATVPKLAAARDDVTRRAALEVLKVELGALEELLFTLEPASGAVPAGARLSGIIPELSDQLVALDANVRQRIANAEVLDELADSLQWSHADFRDEVEPMIGDATFRIRQDLRGGAGSDAASGLDDATRERLRSELSRLEGLQAISALGSLVGAAIRSAGEVTNPGGLEAASFEIEGLFDGIDERLRRPEIRALPEALSLRQTVDDLRRLWDGPDSVRSLRRQELARIQRGQRLVEITQALVDRLRDAVAERLALGSAATGRSADSARAALADGRLTLLAAALASFVVAVAVAWFYVGGNVVRRIRQLDQSMRAIAQGDLKTAVEGAGRDEIGEMAASLRLLRDRLSDTLQELVQAGKLAALGELSAGIAHEMNQPLATIRVDAHNAGRLIERERSRDAVACLERVGTQVERMSAVIDHLRTLARRPSTELEAVDAHETVKAALELVGQRARHEQVRVHADLPDAPCPVLAEPIRLEQVLLNLLGNALDAMRDSTERSLDVSVRQVAGDVAIRVRDTGCGIPEAARDKLFDPFFTTKPVGSGTGLGLSLSFNIVKDFGGTIRVEDTSESGTTILIMLKAQR